MSKSDNPCNGPSVADDLPGPPAPPAGGHWPSGPMPTVEQDRQVLAWLQCSAELGSEVTGYLCDALLDWSLHGGRGYPDMALPAAGPDCDHLQALREIIERVPQRITEARTVREKLALGRAGRLLRRAAWAALEPQAVRESAERELLMGMPEPPAPVARSVRSDGWLL